MGKLRKYTKRIFYPVDVLFVGSYWHGMFSWYKSVSNWLWCGENYFLAFFYEFVLIIVHYNCLIKVWVVIHWIFLLLLLLIEGRLFQWKRSMSLIYCVTNNSWISCPVKHVSPPFDCTILSWCYIKCHLFIFVLNLAFNKGCMFFSSEASY